MHIDKLVLSKQYGVFLFNYFMVSWIPSLSQLFRRKHIGFFNILVVVILHWDRLTDFVKWWLTQRVLSIRIPLHHHLGRFDGRTLNLTTLIMCGIFAGFFLDFVQLCEVEFQYEICAIRVTFVKEKFPTQAFRNLLRNVETQAMTSPDYAFLIILAPVVGFE